MTPKASGAPSVEQRRWYSVRCVLEVRRGKGDRGWPRRYEERVTMWLVDSPHDARAQARAEARSYATRLGRPKLRVLHVSEAFALGGPLTNGREVFSVVRMSSAKSAKFARRYAEDFVPRPGQRASLTSPTSARGQSKTSKGRRKRGGKPVRAVRDVTPAGPELDAGQLAARRALRARRAMSTWAAVGSGSAWVDHVLGGSGTG